MDADRGGGWRARGWVAACCLLTAGAVAADQPALPPNLAVTASISADSQYDQRYGPEHVADGKLPEALGHDDVGAAWAVDGNTHRGGAVLTFTWPQPVAVAEIVYYGRTAWMISECWQGYEVLADGPEPVARGQLEAVHGPQPIRLPEPHRLSRLTIRFTSSYGGANPGASEIQVYPEPLPPGALRLPGELPESAELADELRSGRLGFRELLVVQRQLVHPSHVYSYHCEGLSPGGGLFRAEPAADGTVRMQPLIDASTGVVLNADLSFDGRTIVFCWKRIMDQPFQLYTMDVAGGEPRPVTDGPANNLDPCWLPDGGIAFLSDRKPAYAYCHISTSPTLYRCEADGTRVVRLSASYLNDFTPSVLADGRIVYSRWEYVDRPAIPIQSLWTINPDGTGLAGLYGNRVLSPATLMEAHQVPGSPELLCVLTAHNGPCRGAIGLLDVEQGANAQGAIRNLTPEVVVGPVDSGDGNGVRGPYESPYPVDERCFLVSRAGTLLLRDYAGTGQVTLLRPGPGGGFFSPRPLRPRPRPPRLASPLPDEAEPWADVLVQDVYRGLEPAVRRGEVTRLAVVQEIEKSQWASNQVRAFGFQFPVVSCGATYAPKRVCGFATVEPDGSAHFRAPAGVPLYFMALDGEGRAVQRMRTFTHFMPGERQGCVGCHAHRAEAAATNSHSARAARRAAEPLAPPEWGDGGFSYAHVVQPVLDRHCVTCHNAGQQSGGIDLSGDRTDFFNVSYDNLARRGTPAEDAGLGGYGVPFRGSPLVSWIPTYNGQEPNILDIAPRAWGSPASPLAGLLLGGHPDQAGAPRVELTPDERQRVLTWMDLDVPYYGTSSSRHPDLLGCRRIYPGRLDQVLGEVADRRCAGCHAKVPRRFYTRITRPELNEFLLAPLAAAEGGTEACGKPVFASREDPDYRLILATFDETTRLLEEAPRADMVAPSPSCPLPAEAPPEAAEQTAPKPR